MACPAPVDEALTAWEAEGFTGAVAITGADGPWCIAGYGLADRGSGRAVTPDAVFALGSVSKAFTAAVVLSLVDDGVLDLGTEAGEVVPGLTGPAGTVTVEQLLVHTSGIGGTVGADHQPVRRDEAVAHLSGVDLAFEPGSDHLYSNAGYTLLALAVEAVTGTAWRDVVVDRVLTGVDGVVGGFWDGEPAAPGPRAVGYLDGGGTGADGGFDGPHWALAGNGDLAMSMPELATWTRALFSGDVLSVGSTELIATAAVVTGPGSGESPGWMVSDHDRLGEPVVASVGGGGDVGHDVVVAWLPESERVVAVASSTPEVTAEDLLAVIGPAVVAGEDLPRPEVSDRPGPSAEERARLTGTYAVDDGNDLVVAEDGDRLAVSARGGTAVAALFPLPEGVSEAEADSHETAVVALLTGDSTAGREERAALEDDIGPVDSVAAVGTLVDDGELRTYVRVTSGGDETTVWYALEGDTVAAVEIVNRPPTAVLDPVGPERFRVHIPSGRGVDVALTFSGDSVTVSGPSGSTTAERR